MTNLIESGLPVGTVVRHKKRGTFYTIVAHGMTEWNQHPCVVYRPYKMDTATVWVRPWTEFYDGRFEEVVLAWAGDSELQQPQESGSKNESR